MCLFYDTRSFLRPVNMCYEVLLPVLSADVTNKLVKFHMNKKILSRDGYYLNENDTSLIQFD